MLERLSDEGKLESTLEVLEDAAMAHSSTDRPPLPKREKHIYIGCSAYQIN